MKFPINSIEISFIAGLTAAILYIVLSLLTCKEPFNLEQLLHRGRYALHANDGTAGATNDGGVSRHMTNDEQTSNSSLSPKTARHSRAERAPSSEGHPSFAKRVLAHLVGITPEFTREDRIIAWLGFFKHMVWDWVVAFLLCSIAAKVFHWGVREWAMRCFVVVLVVPICINIVTTVWFTWGTVRDLGRLFRDLSARKRNDLDNGMVEGHVSLADK